MTSAGSGLIRSWGIEKLYVPQCELKMVFIASFPVLNLVRTASVKSELIIADSTSGVVWRKGPP